MALDEALAPSPPGDVPCRCGHPTAEHWIGEPGGCEAAGGCGCGVYRPVEVRP